MGFSQFGGTTIVPTLSRLVLAAAFVSAGYGKFFENTEFTAAQAASLDSIGVTLEPAGAATASAGEWRVIHASFQQDEDAGEEDKSGEKADETAEDAPAPEEAKDDAPAVGSTPPVASGTYVGKKRHMVTLMIANQGWPAPTLLSLMAAMTELVGGGLLLIGFLTRIWGLGLAIAMGSAFYLVTLQVAGFELLKPLAYAANTDLFHAAFVQLALGVLAIGLVFTGAGPLSVDRLLFGSGKRAASKVEVAESDLDDGLG